MGVNQDAYDVWTDDFKDERRKFLDVLYFTNLEHKLPLPNQDDFSIKNYDDLDNKTKLAIKEFIFAMNDADYRETFDLIMNEADEMIDEYAKN